ncbi:MAG: peptidoglycan-associated lipoprotein Pal [Gammaproteobacteria bacterium]|nr:peptidoglycan-associated lipoprotein Pal [Gammaproteobacteria bacterium]
MKLRMLKIIPVAALALLFAGCSTTGGDKGEVKDGAPVTDAGTSGTGTDEGAQITGASEGSEWTGNPLDNPDSMLSVRVIYFDYDIADVREDFRDAVIAHGEYLATNPAVTVTIEGHADERGSREYNIGLGERRANAVTAMLMAQGVSQDQITTISYGEERPEAMGSNEDSWSQNRRAVFLY